MCVILAEGHPQNSTHFRSLSNAWDSHQATPRGMMQILTFESAKRILCAVTVRAFPCASSACVWGGQACAPVCIWRLKVWLQVLFCGCLRFLFWGVVTNWPGTPKEARQASLWVSETPILPTQNYTNICHHAQWLFSPSPSPSSLSPSSPSSPSSSSFWSSCPSSTYDMLSWMCDLPLEPGQPAYQKVHSYRMILPLPIVIWIDVGLNSFSCWVFVWLELLLVLCMLSQLLWVHTRSYPAVSEKHCFRAPILHLLLLAGLLFAMISEP